MQTEANRINLNDKTRVTFDDGFSYEMSILDFIGQELGFDICDPIANPGAKHLDEYCIANMGCSNIPYYSSDQVSEIIYDAIMFGKGTDSTVVNWIPFPSIANLPKEDVLTLIKNSYFYVYD